MTTALALYDPPQAILDKTRARPETVEKFKKDCNAWRDRYLLDDQKRSVVVKTLSPSGAMEVVGIEVLSGDDIKTRKLSDLPFPGWRYKAKSHTEDKEAWIPDVRVPHGETVYAARPQVYAIAWDIVPTYDEFDEYVLEFKLVDDIVNRVAFQVIEQSENSETPYILATFTESDSQYDVYSSLLDIGFK